MHDPDQIFRVLAQRVKFQYKLDGIAEQTINRRVIQYQVFVPFHINLEDYFLISEIVLFIMISQ